MNNKNIKVVDEHSIDREANVLFAFDLGGSEYISYSIERDEDNKNIFISKIIKNLDGTFNMLDIDDPMEKSKLSETVKTLITTAVSNSSGKLEGESTILADGTVVKFMAASFNKEQRINVQKTYITTVKKDVVDMTEKYYTLEEKLEEQNLFNDIFPMIDQNDNSAEVDIRGGIAEVGVSSDVASSNVGVAPTVVNQQNVGMDLSAPKEETAPKVNDDGFIAFGSETTISKAEVEPQVIPRVNPEQPLMMEEPKSTLQETVVPEVTPIPVVQPMVNVVSPEPVIPTVIPSPAPTVMPEVAPAVSQPVTPTVVPTEVKVEPAPLVFDATKESNLNAALGEVASSSSIPVENIQSVREFGVDEETVQPVASTLVNPTPAPTDNGTPSSKAGFAKSKFFVVVAIAFFLASCTFLGYEVFNYFRLVK